MVKPCEICTTPEGRHGTGRDYPMRLHGLCDACYTRIYKRHLRLGISFAEARARDTGPSTLHRLWATRRDGRRTPTPMPARRGFREAWED